MTKYLSISSGKKGAGSTTAAVNIAAALNNWGMNITLLDANLSAPSINTHFGFMPKSTLHNVLAGEKHILEAVHLHPSGLKIVPGAAAIQKKYPKRFSSALLDLF